MPRKRKAAYNGPVVLGKYYQQGRMFVTLSDELVDSDAYQDLTPLQRCILHDLWRVIRHKFRDVPAYNAENAPFTYTYSECRVPCGSNAFHEAMRKLTEIGWVERHAKNQPLRVAGPIWHTVSKRWKKHRSSQENAMKRRAARAKKERRIQEDLRRRLAMHSK